MLQSGVRVRGGGGGAEAKKGILECPDQGVWAAVEDAFYHTVHPEGPALCLALCPHSREGRLCSGDAQGMAGTVNPGLPGGHHEREDGWGALGIRLPMHMPVPAQSHLVWAAWPQDSLVPKLWSGTFSWPRGLCEELGPPPDVPPGYHHRLRRAME